KWISAGDGIRPNLVKRGHTLAGGKTSIQLAQTGWRRREAVTMKDGFGGDVFLVKATKKEDLVLDPGPADGESGKLVVEARRPCQRIGGHVHVVVFLEIAHRI